MAWIYLAESADSPSPLANGSDPSLTASEIPTVRECFYLDLQMVDYPMPQFGMMFEPLPFMEPQVSWIFSTEVSPARGLALQDMEKAWQMSEADCFSRSFAWPKKSSPSSYSLKMSLQSPHAAAFESLEKLPKWGMTVDGVLYPLEALERYTYAKGGSYLPTPCAQEAGRTYEQHMEMKRKMGRNTCSSLSALVGMLPTPQACDGTKGPAKEYIPNGKQSSMRNLVTYAARFSSTGKILNPPFVEWLMGYPTGWTELEPWAMLWFLAKRKKRSKS